MSRSAFLVILGILAVTFAGVFCAMPGPDLQEVAAEKSDDSASRKQALERNYNIGYEYMKNKQFADAITKFETALAIDSTYAPGYFGLGYTHYSMNEFDKAITNYNLALKYRPDYVAAMRNLAILYMNTGNAEGALRMYRKVIDVDPGEMTEEKKKAMLDLGQLYVNVLRDYGNAIGVYEQLVQHDSTDVESWQNLARLYNLQEMPRKEIEANKHLLAMEPGDSAYPMNIGNIYMKLNELDNAKEYYQKAIDNDPNNIQAYINLGIVFLNQANFEEAKKLYNRAVASDPTNAKALCGLAEVFVEEGNLQEALRLTKQVISTNPTEGQAYIVRGKVIERRADAISKLKGRENELKSDILYRRAVEEFEKALGDRSWATYARQKVRQLSSAFMSDQEIKEREFFLSDEQKKELQSLSTVPIEKIL